MEEVQSTPKKMFKLINSAMLLGRKTNAQKSVVFLHTNNEQFEKEIKKIIPLLYDQKE